MMLGLIAVSYHLWQQLLTISSGHLLAGIVVAPEARCAAPLSTHGQESGMSVSSGITLVTGGAGFIGSHLVERLLALGHDVRVVDDLSTGNADNLAAVLDHIEFLRGDLR